MLHKQGRDNHSCFFRNKFLDLTCKLTGLHRVHPSAWSFGSVPQQHEVFENSSQWQSDARRVVSEVGGEVKDGARGFGRCRPFLILAIAKEFLQ